MRGGIYDASLGDVSFGPESPPALLANIVVFLVVSSTPTNRNAFLGSPDRGRSSHQTNPSKQPSPSRLAALHLCEKISYVFSHFFRFRQCSVCGTISCVSCSGAEALMSPCCVPPSITLGDPTMKVSFVPCVATVALSPREGFSQKVVLLRESTREADYVHECIQQFCPLSYHFHIAYDMIPSLKF